VTVLYAFSTAIFYCLSSTLFHFCLNAFSVYESLHTVHYATIYKFLLNFLSWIIYKKLIIRRWDSELSLRWHRTHTIVHKFCHRSTRLCDRFTKFSEITQYNGRYAVQSHSRSLIRVPIERSYTTSYWRLILTYLDTILHRFQVMADYWSHFREREWSAFFNALAEGWSPANIAISNISLKLDALAYISAAESFGVYSTTFA